MDIVSLYPPARRSQKRARRHTTEVRLADLPTAEDTEKEFEQPSALHAESSSLKDVASEGELKSCWDSLDAEATGIHYEGSQVEDLAEMSLQSMEVIMPKHGYQLSYELALDNMLTSFVRGHVSTSHVDHVIMEIISTEETYVQDLTDIIQGYISPLECQIGTLHIDMVDIENIFGNVKDIKDFNVSVLNSLKECRWNRKGVGQCFLDKAEGFKSYYSVYCNNYPKSIKFLLKVQDDSSISQFFKMCQQQLNHMLPLGAYLLKPVQRVMKYPLLLRQLIKNMCVEDHGFSEVSSAVDKMTSVSKHINEMKEEYDADVYVRGLDNLIKGCEGVVDLVTAGGLVLEGNLRYAGGRSTIPSLRSRADRHLYIFQFKRLMLLTKKDEDGYQYKTHLEITDIQLAERVEKETNSFQVRQVSTGNFYNLQAETHKGKEKWVNTIKKLLMESIPDLPDKARMLIMAGFPTDNSSKSLRNESSQAQTSRNTRAKHRKRSSTSPGSLTSQLVQASLVATLQLEPFQEQSGEQQNRGAEVCNSAESIVDDLMELAIETPEKKTKDTGVSTSDEATQMLHLSPAKVKRSEKKKSVVDATKQLTKYDDEPCQPFSKGFSGCGIVQNLSIVKEANSKQKTEEDNMSIDGDEVTVPHLTVYGTNTDQRSDTSLCLNQGDMQTLKVLLCDSQESVTETYEESLGTPRLAPPLEFTDSYIDSLTTHVGRGLDDDEFVLPESNNMCQSKESSIGVSTPRNPPTDHTQKSILNGQTCPKCLTSQSIHCQEQICLCEASIISKTCTTHEKVLHTNIEHYSSPKLEENQHSSPNLEQRGMFPFVLQQSQTQKAAKPTLRHMHPYTGNPEEELSFDEVLQHYDNYASSTGKTARSWRVSQLSGSPSLPKGEKRRKDRKRSMTVASLDRTTLLAAAEGTFSQPSTESPKKPHSKVRHLAREYSRRIKDHQMNKHSPVNDKASALPNWLPEIPVEQLVKSSKETTNHPVENLSWMGKKDSRSSPKLHPEQTSMTVYHIPPTDFQLQTSPTTNNKGLKGLVKSLVVKFGGGK